MSWIGPVLLFIALAVTVVLTANWCARDAELRGKSPILLLLAVIFFFPWGWIAWLLFRPPPIFRRRYDSPEGDQDGVQEESQN